MALVVRGLHLPDIPGSIVGPDGERIRSRTPVLAHMGRQFVTPEINGLRVPFYRSSGMAPKEGVKPGGWYPAMGISPDGWINKSRGMETYYDSPELRAVAEHLDEHLGNPKEKAWAKKMGATTSESERFINRDMLVTPEPLHSGSGAVYENTEHIRRQLSGVPLQFLRRN